METDRLIAVATLAANTAHQLGTPINSISLLATELNEVSTKNDDHQIHQHLAGQIDRCKSILNSLVHTADLALQDGHQEVPVQQYFTDLIDRWSVLHPDQSIHLDRHSLASADRSFTPSTSLEPAIFNLLNNAAQSGGDRIEISFDFRENHMQMRLSDNGSGIPNEIMQRLGQPFNSNKPEGMGIGLYLAITTIEAMGGSIAFIPNTTSTKGTKEATGTTLDLNLPIRATEK